MQISDSSCAGMTDDTAPRQRLRILARLIAWYQHRRALAKTRRELARFDNFMLRDIGLSRADAEDELSKGFWR